MADVYKVSASFDVNDKISKKLEDVIKRLDLAQAALDKSTAAMLQFGAAAEYATLALTPFNVELSMGSRRLTAFTTRAERSFMAIQSMSVAARVGSTNFARMNNQLAVMATNAQAAARGMGNLGRRTGAGGNIPGGSGGGSHGGGDGGHGGGFMSGVGGFFNKTMMAMIGFDMVKSGMHPAMEYQQQRSGLEAMGLNRTEMQTAERTAAVMQRQMPATTRTENLQQIKELYGIFRKFPEAIELAPDFAKFQIALHGVGNRIPSLKGNEGSFATATAKSAETLGRLSPEKFKDFLNQSLASYESTGGLVTPLHTAQALKFSRGVRYGKGDNWNFGVMSFLLEEAALGKGGGGSRGVGPLVTGLQRTFGIGGKMDKRLISDFASMGLFKGTTAGGGTGADKLGLNTTTLSTGTTTELKNQDKMVSNPYEWFKDNFIPALKKAEKLSDAEFQNLKKTQDGQAKLAAMVQRHTRGMNVQVGDAVLQFVMLGDQIDLFVKNRKKALSVDEAYNKVMENTALKSQAAGAALYTLSQNIGLALAPAMNVALDLFTGLAKVVNDLDDTMPDTVDALKEMNDALFGAKGLFYEVGDAISKLPGFDKKTKGEMDSAAAWEVKTNKAFIDAIKEQSKDMLHPGNGEQHTRAKNAGIRWRNMEAAAYSGKNPFMTTAFDRQIYMYNHRNDEILPGSENTLAHGMHKMKQLEAAQKSRSLLMDTVGGPKGTKAGQFFSGIGQGMAAPVVNIHFNGGVMNVKEVIDKVVPAVNKAFAQAAHLFQATTGVAGGTWNNRTM